MELKIGVLYSQNIIHFFTLNISKTTLKIKNPKTSQLLILYSDAPYIVRGVSTYQDVCLWFRSGSLQTQTRPE